MLAVKPIVALYYPRTAHQQNYSEFWLPYSTLAIGSALQDMDVDVLLFDNNQLQHDSLEEFGKYLVDSASIVGISSMIGHQIEECINLITVLRKLKPTLPIVIGGALPTMLPELTASESGADFVVRGQGEFPFMKLVAAILSGADHSSIPGLTWKNRETGRLESTPDYPPTNRNRLPPFDYGLVDVESYVRNDPSIHERTINYISSQGCPFDCGFCSDTRLFQKRWVPQKPSQMITDIQFLQESYNIGGIKFYDSNFFVNTRRVSDFCQKLKDTGLKIHWGAACHPETFLSLDDAYLEKLRTSGCRRLLIGTESGDADIIKMVGKDIQPEDSITIAERCAKYDICVSFTFIVGFPGQDRIHIDRTLDLARSLRAIDPRHEVKVHIYAPFPMTKLYPVALEHGFSPPDTLRQWASYDYYAKQTQFITNEDVELVSEFNLDNSPSVSGSRYLRADAT